MTKDIDKEHILEVDVKFLNKLQELQSDLPFLTKRMKIEKCEKLVTYLYNKKKLYHNAWLKP